MPELRADVSPAAKPFPRLAISDLLVLTLMVSFGLGWMESLGSGDPPAESLWRTVVLSVLEATLLGGLFFGFAVLAREFVRGRPLRSLSPAHWWFVVAAPQLLFGLAHFVIAIWSPTWFAGNQGQWRIFESSTDAAGRLVFAALWGWAASIVQPWRWRIVFMFKTLEQLDWLIFQLHRTAKTIGLGWTPRIAPMHFFGSMGSLWVCLVMALTVAVVLDVRSKVRRDWLHYVGVGVIVVEALDFFQGFGTYLVKWWSAIYRLALT